MSVEDRKAGLCLGEEETQGSPHRDTEESLRQEMKQIKDKGEIRHLEQQKSSEIINETRHKSTKVLPGDTGEILHQYEEFEFV